ncbi:MAG TPA: transposase [Thermoanaerobaculia bacterium]|nr:transposase [Thermoanaerobaculia bacterium]
MEVTTRTIHGRFLLTPSAELNELILGVLGRAQELFPVGLVAFAFASGHYHLLLRVENTHQLAGFMNHLNSNLAREAGRLAGWREKFWASRFQAIPVSNEPAAQIERLTYVLAHGCKEGLVERLRDWPGVSAVATLLDGAPLIGHWFDRSREHFARLRGKSFQRLEFATEYRLRLEALPCWAHLPTDQYRQRIADLVAEIEARAALERQATGRPALGPAAVCAQRPHDGPAEPKRSPAPLFHAASRRVRLELRRAYGEFVGAFRVASAKLRAGARDAVFPAGSFPPSLPWVET